MSPRPKRTRKMIHPPGFRGFKPFGCPETKGGEIKLLLEEYEAIRLSDYQNLTQVEASIQMGISRPTFSRIHENARKKIATAFMEVSSIVIEGGNIETDEDWLHCPECHTIFKVTDAETQSTTCPICKHQHTEKINTPELPELQKNNSGDNERCICPKCDYSKAHVLNQPCRSSFCPDCGISMIRENSTHHKQFTRKLKKNQNLK